TSGHTSSCGRCNELPPEHWKQTWYGYLKLADQINLHPSSNKKLDWICKCGGILNCSVHNVTSGRTIRCKKCLKKNKSEKITVFPKELDTLLEDISRQMAHKLRHDFINVQQEILDFIKLFDPHVESQYEINRINYSVFVPSANLIIEYQRLNEEDLTHVSRRDNYGKYCNAINDGYDYVMIYEDEWLNNKQKVQSLISNRISRSKPKTLRPKQCWLEFIKSKDTIDFYNEYHYIGSCRAKVHIGVFYDYELIACASFGHPTRQTIKHEWELLRMVSHSEYRVHGIWSKLIKKFV